MHTNQATVSAGAKLPDSGKLRHAVCVHGNKPQADEVEDMQGGRLT